MSYRNPLHGLDHNGDREESDPTDTVPDMTADSTDDPVLGEELDDHDGPQEGRHPDGSEYEPYTADDQRAQYDAADLPLPALKIDRIDHVILSDEETVIELEGETAEPDSRCSAATASPIDSARRCHVHPDGAHHCYRGPGHQHERRTTPLTEEPHADDEWVVPEWARHWCDCGFAWADIVQPRGPRSDGQPSTAERFRMELRMNSSGEITMREIEHG
jgi:hypothetical protein